MKSAFDHTVCCDAYLSETATLDANGRLTPGTEAAHQECDCWCHNWNDESEDSE